MADGCGPSPRPLRLGHAYNAMLGRWIAIAYDRHPLLGDQDLHVVAVEFLVSEEKCFAWFERVQEERPWRRR